MLKRIASNRPSPAMVVSLIALFVALGGTSIAVSNIKAKSVGTKQLKNDAVTGKKADESSFDTVPKAKDSLNADNADSLGGFSDADFVLGSGSQFGFAGTLGNLLSDGLTFRDNTDKLIVTCLGTPSLTWQADRDDSGSPPTDIFSEFGHTVVADGAANTNIGGLSNGSHDVEVWTGDDLVLSARIGVSRDPSGDCQLSVFANVQPNAASGTSSGDRAQVGGRVQIHEAN
jgi:hypothetical protein